MRCDNVEVWVDWYSEFSHRRVKKSFLGEIAISTIFLGVNNEGFDNAHPVLWETMAFRIRDNEVDEVLECERCTGTREQALAMHAKMCARVESFTFEPSGQWP